MLCTRTKAWWAWGWRASAWGHAVGLKGRRQAAGDTAARPFELILSALHASHIVMARTWSCCASMCTGTPCEPQQPSSCEQVPCPYLAPTHHTRVTTPSPQPQPQPPTRPPPCRASQQLQRVEALYRGRVDAVRREYQVRYARPWAATAPCCTNAGQGTALRRGLLLPLPPACCTSPSLTPASPCWPLKASQASSCSPTGASASAHNPY